MVIGVANYEVVGGLPDAVLNDALDTAETLKSSVYCGYPEANITVLTDDAATLENIRKALADLAATATTDDTAAIFFSGHGIRIGRGAGATSALVPYDYKLTDVAGTTLGEAELSAAIAAINAPRLIVVIDVLCRRHRYAQVRPRRNMGRTGSTKGFDEKSLQQLARGTGRLVLASSRATETSLVLRRERNSVFTTAMLSGLKGAATAANDGDHPGIRPVQPRVQDGEAVRSGKAAPSVQGERP